MKEEREVHGRYVNILTDAGFGKPLDSCDSLLDKWCYVLKHVGNLDGRPDGLGQIGRAHV